MFITWVLYPMALFKRYFKDITREGKSSDVAVLVIGGIIFFLAWSRELLILFLFRE